MVQRERYIHAKILWKVNMHGNHNTWCNRRSVFPSSWKCWTSSPSATQGLPSSSCCGLSLWMEWTASPLRMVPLVRPAGVGGGFGSNSSRTWRHLRPRTHSGTIGNVQGPSSAHTVGGWGRRKSQSSRSFSCADLSCLEAGTSPPRSRDDDQVWRVNFRSCPRPLVLKGRICSNTYGVDEQGVSKIDKKTQRFFAFLLNNDKWIKACQGLKDLLNLAVQECSLGKLWC